MPLFTFSLYPVVLCLYRTDTAFYCPPKKLSFPTNSSVLNPFGLWYPEDWPCHQLLQCDCLDSLKYILDSINTSLCLNFCLFVLFWCLFALFVWFLHLCMAFRPISNFCLLLVLCIFWSVFHLSLCLQLGACLIYSELDSVTQDASSSLSFFSFS